LQGNQSKLPSISSPQDETLSTLCKESLASLENRTDFQNDTDEIDLTPDNDVLESIQSEYFLEEGFDPSLHELHVNNTQATYCRLSLSIINSH